MKKEKRVAGRFTLERQKMIWAYIFLLIPIIFFLYIRLYPTAMAFRMSLYDYNSLRGDFTQQEFIGLENYEDIWEDLQKPRDVTRRAFENTAFYVLLGVPIQLVLSLAIALMLNEIRRFDTLYRLIFFLPFVTSTIAIAWVFRLLYAPGSGLINTFLDAFSLPNQPFLDSPAQAPYAITAMVVWQGMGFAIIIFLAGLKQIPRTYYEAARIDGATRLQIFRRITIPLLNATFVYLIVLQTISFLRMFAPVLAMTTQGDGGPLNSTTTVVLRVYREAFQKFDMGYAAALTVVLFAIILVITIFQLGLTSRRTD